MWKGVVRIPKYVQFYTNIRIIGVNQLAMLPLQYVFNRVVLSSSNNNGGWERIEEKKYIRMYVAQVTGHVLIWE